MALKIGNVFINEDDPFPVIVKATTEIDTYIKGHHVYKNIWTFLLWAPFFSRKEPKIVFWIHDALFMFSKAEWVIRKRSNVRILVKKLEFYWKSSER